VGRERRAEAEEGRGGTWGGASKCVSAPSVTVWSALAASLAGRAPGLQEGRRRGARGLSRPG
jgi:hypothetical protein